MRRCAAVCRQSHAQGLTHDNPQVPSGLEMAFKVCANAETSASSPLLATNDDVPEVPRATHAAAVPRARLPARRPLTRRCWRTSRRRAARSWRSPAPQVRAILTLQHRAHLWMLCARRAGRRPGGVRARPTARCSPPAATVVMVWPDRVVAANVGDSGVRAALLRCWRPVSIPASGT